MKLIALAVAATCVVAAILFFGVKETEAPSFAQINDNRSQKEPVPDIAEQKMVEIYDGVRVSSNTRVLSIAGRSFSGSLKAEVGQLKELQTLDISDNRFTGLPAEVGRLDKLEVLNLSNNPLTGLPYELGNLKNLKTLDLRGTDYSATDLEVIRANLPQTTNILVSQATNTSNEEDNVESLDSLED